MGWFASPHVHEWEQVGVCYAPPLSVEMVRVHFENDMSITENETLGVTTFVQQCTTCKEMRQFEVLGQSQQGGQR